MEHGCPSKGHRDLAGEPGAVQPPSSILVPVVVACHPPDDPVPILTPHPRERAEGYEERERGDASEREGGREEMT